MNEYVIEKVPTYLLYDALSWMIKTKALVAHFYREETGEKVTLAVTSSDIKTELAVREKETPNPSIRCQKCGEVTDGRTVWGEPPRQPICPPCYWEILRVLGSSTGILAGRKPYVADAPEAKEETREDIAARLGLPLEALEANGYFDQNIL